ncbi:hypothetical protein [Paenibacillus silviterrae]|uniref:hypothetical protein n=1 Tax=Paenibacillus silviterrae TaxID=3242194 RepID=UPI0025439A0B|nr:hypothetical protein [Paenibacillus chinjuensis]
MLTTIAIAKQMLGIAEDDMTQDGQLTLALIASSQRIEQECRRSFKKQSYKERASGLGRNIFLCEIILSNLFSR